MKSAFLATILACIPFCFCSVAVNDGATIGEAAKSKVRGAGGFIGGGTGDTSWPSLLPPALPPVSKDWDDVFTFDSEDSSNPFSETLGPAYAKRFLLFATSKIGSSEVQYWTPEQADLWCKTNACSYDRRSLSIGCDAPGTW